jgi:hypothetical protein
MPLPWRAREDPFLQRVHLFWLQFLVRVRRRHLVVLIGRDDPCPEFALFQIARDDGRFALGCLLEKPLLRVQPQTGLARVVVGAMAGEAIVRKNGPHVAIEANGAIGCGQFHRAACQRRHYRHAQNEIPAHALHSDSFRRC